MRFDYNNRKVLISIFFIALIVRLFALVVVEPVSAPMTWEYEEIANNILEGKGLFWTFYNTPYRSTYMVLYPLLCSFVYALTNHSYLALKILQIIISLITLFLVYRISFRLFDQRVALLSLFLAGFHPGLIFYSVRLHSLTLDTFLFTLQFFLFLKILERKSIDRFSLLFGITFGPALLSRSTIAPFLFVVLLFIFLKLRDDKALCVRVITLILISITVVLLPLWVRNYIVFDRVVISPNDSALAFWLGYNEDATGTNKTLNGDFIFEIAPQEFRKTILSMDEFGQKEYFYKQGLEFIKQHPLESLVLYFKKIKYFWWFTPTQGLEYPKVYFDIYKFYWIFILAFFILGIYQKFATGLTSQSIKYGTISVVLFLVTLTLVHALYNLDGRHRWAVESFVLIFAANGINFLLKKKEQRR
ncbi:MAG: glycosyltransferase family 39 protein [Candidatus Omnitrophica bacterium]|nr:glycosyltransferase family 39 protein [Candidatus Omnitrophota bacterium]